MSTIYIAGSSLEIPRVRAAQKLATDAGLKITFDWTIDVEKSIAEKKTDADLTPTQAKMYAAIDLAAIRDANFFWLLVPTTSSKGAWVELGYALGNNKRILVTGARGSIFSTLAHYTNEVDEHGFQAAQNWQWV